ncbi:MAG: hypothetical protein JRI25_28820 [Deltaproteobacteria bacterium]|nr:hypothetical protein [Deltaproteobacteria bacterium]
MSFVGAGRFERFDSPDAITLDQIGLLKLSSLLEAKSLLVTNLSALPGLDGPVPDGDRDGLGDEIETTLGTDPLVADSDGDGLGDMVETLISLDPLVAEAALPPCAELEGPPWGDVDTDFLNDCEELLLGTNPTLPDTDGDSYPDWVEVSQHTDYLRADALDDADWDGARNGDEIAAHTDPGSADANSHLADAYRYDVTDEGFVTEPNVRSPRDVVGVTVLGAGADTAGGLGILGYAPGPPPTLSWQSPQDETPGPAVEVGATGSYRLYSSSAVSGEVQRWIEVEVEPALLPPDPVEELLLVELSEQNCLSWTVRNIRLVEGDNDVFVYFAESPQGQLTRPGLFRLAHIPVHYDPDTGREPSAPLVEVGDEEFASIGD